MARARPDYPKGCNCGSDPPGSRTSTTPGTSSYAGSCHGPTSGRSPTTDATCPGSETTPGARSLVSTA